MKKLLNLIAALGFYACSTDAIQDRPGLNGQDYSDAGNSDAAVVEENSDLSKDIIADGENDAVINQNPCVKVESFIHLGGSASREYFQATHPLVMENYSSFTNEGIINFSFRHYPMTPNSLSAAEAAECARNQGEDLFIRYITRLFETQERWADLGNLELINVLKEYGRSLELESRLFYACVDERDTREAVTNDYEYADARMTKKSEEGVFRGTPTFFVNDEIPFIDDRPLQGAVAYSTLSEAIDNELTGCTDI